MGFKLQVFGKVMGRFAVGALAYLLISLVVSEVYDRVVIEPQYEELAGEWAFDESADEELIEEILESVGLEEEEIAVVSEESFDIIATLELTEYQTYSFTYDIEATQEQVRAFWKNVFDTLYEQRDELVSVYGDISDYTKEDFQSQYASSNGVDDFEELLDLLVEDGFDWERLSDKDQQGTFKIKNKSIVFSESGKSSDRRVSFQLNGNSLTLTYSDGKEHYTRITE